MICGRDNEQSGSSRLIAARSVEAVVTPSVSIILASREYSTSAYQSQP